MTMTITMTMTMAMVIMEPFSVECYKTKTKVIILANSKGHTQKIQ